MIRGIATGITAIALCIAVVIIVCTVGYLCNVAARGLRIW